MLTLPAGLSVTNCTYYPKPPILIDGEHLSRLMVEHNIGVSTVGLYEVKKLDSDYFDNE